MKLVLDCCNGSRKKSFLEGVLALFNDEQLDVFAKSLNEHLAFIGTVLQINRDANEMVETTLSYMSDCQPHPHEHGDSHNSLCSHHEHMHDDHKHEHHSVGEVHRLIQELDLSDSVSNDLFGIYDIIAQAEAKAHGVELSDVHFHEVGNLEAISYLTASALAMNQLHADEIVATPICTGFGFVECAHGTLPIPAPATANIITDLPTFVGDIEGELTTPTGAALVKYYAQAFIDNAEIAGESAAGILNAPTIKSSSSASNVKVAFVGRL